MKIFFMLFCFIITGFFNTGNVSAVSSNDLVLCTQELKLCSDEKTWVGRTGPSCEFSECPSTQICPSISAPYCEYGFTEGTSTFVDGCEYPNFTCNDAPQICPSVALPYCEFGYEVVGMNYLDGCEIPEYSCKENILNCPVFTLAIPQNGCSYEYKKDSIGCSVPHLVCEEEEEELTVCTAQYQPVCGQPAFYCPAGSICAQVLPSPQTYSNTCNMEADGATLLYNGICGTNTDEEEEEEEIIEVNICPVYSLLAPGEGCAYEYYENNNGCSTPKLVCEEIEEDFGGCTTESAPVCGKVTNNCEAGPGSACAAWVYAEETFSNECYMENAGATFLYKGECGSNEEEEEEEEELKICTAQYDPVCGEKEVQCIKAPCLPIQTTYGNTCNMEADGATLLYNGICGTNTEIEEEITPKLKERTDTVLDTVASRLEALNLEEADRIAILDKKITKLESLLDTGRSKKITVLINYLIVKLTALK